MTGQEIINTFELKVDDQSTLSSGESLALANEVYRRVLDYKPWEWLKKEGTGTVSNKQVTAPSDFKFFSANYDSPMGDFIPVVFVGSDYEPYEVIPFSQRNDSRYRDNDNFVYYDARQGLITFTGDGANGKSIVYDYIYQPDDLELATSPVFPTRFHDIIFYGMAVDFPALDNTPKNRSYAEEYEFRYEQVLLDMCYENSKIYGRANY